MEGDQTTLHRSQFVITFQSTPSAWRETLPAADVFSVFCDFNPLPPHGGRLVQVTINFQFLNISIHSLRMEGDEKPYFPEQKPGVFQSTPSAWRETIVLYIKLLPEIISIHSLRMEGD